MNEVSELNLFDKERKNYKFDIGEINKIIELLEINSDLYINIDNLELDISFHKGGLEEVLTQGFVFKGRLEAILTHLNIKSFELTQGGQIGDYKTLRKMGVKYIGYINANDQFVIISVGDNNKDNYVVNSINRPAVLFYDTKSTGHLASARAFGEKILALLKLNDRFTSKEDCYG